MSDLALADKLRVHASFPGTADLYLTPEEARSIADALERKESLVRTEVERIWPTVLAVAVRKIREDMDFARGARDLARDARRRRLDALIWWLAIVAMAVQATNLWQILILGGAS